MPCGDLLGHGDSELRLGVILENRFLDTIADGTHFKRRRCQADKARLELLPNRKGALADG